MYVAMVSGGSKSDSWGIAAPLALFAIVNIFGGVSGGHFNPAVTLGVWVRERKYAENFCFMLFIIISQITGALVGMMLGYSVLRVKVEHDYTILPSQIGLLLPSQYTGEDALKDKTIIDFVENWTTFYMEVICTFVFVLFILFVSGKRTAGIDLGAFTVPCICLVLWALCSVDYFTGASFNPALAIA